MTMLLWLFLGIVLNGLTSISANPQKTPQLVQNLVLGEVVERSIAGGEQHSYAFTLEAGQYGRITVEQRAVEVVMTLYNEDGRSLIEVDSAGKETASVIASQKTTIRVMVRARQEAGAGGTYLIRMEEHRAAVPEDQARINAERLTAEGALLSVKAAKDSLQGANEKYQAALKLWRELQDEQEEARTCYLLGLGQQAGGELQAAMESYQQSLVLSRREGDRVRENLALNALGTLYFRLGDKPRAIDCYKQALAFSQALGERSLETSILVNLGAVYKAIGDHGQAVDLYRKAVEMARELGDQTSTAAALTNLARLYDLMGDRQNAYATNQQVLLVWRALGNLEGEAVTLKNLGALAEAEGRFVESLEYLTRALALNQAGGNPMREAYIRGDLARIERSSGNFEHSREQIEQSLKIFESLRIQLLNPDVRASFIAANRRYYEFYIDLLMQQHLRSSNETADKPSQNYAAEALRVSESARARALADLIAEARVDIRQGVDVGLLARERELVQTLMTKKAERAALLKLTKKKREEIEQLDREILALGLSYEQAKTAIKRASPQYAALVYPESIGLVEIQQLLDSDTLLLEYALGEERSYLWVVGDDTLHSFTLPGRAVIEAQARGFYERLAAPGETIKYEKPEQKRSRVARAIAELPVVAAALSQTLLAPAGDMLGQKRLLISGDGILNYIPFSALPEPALRKNLSVAQQNPLLVKHEVINLPSASVLAELRRDIFHRQQATRDLAIVADPVFTQNDKRLLLSQNDSSFQNPPTHKEQSYLLPMPVAASKLMTATESSERDTQDLSRLMATRGEAERIARLVPESRRLMALDFEATRDLVISGSLSQYRMLHFATHGLLNSQTPELSGLVFSLVNESGQSQLGVLRLNDVFNLKLAAELVVLSACRTGLGKEVRGEGALSLARGFMYAGVPRVISSLWAINDQAAAELMSHLYQQMLLGDKTPAAALRAAQLALWKEKRWSFPYYWAGFILQGEPK
ncbi:MAG: CHAT domain-containing protein [Acidobacteria bacterium]|nr:CHAT domain-containing protein [Acidobacteriota bacterium]